MSFEATPLRGVQAQYGARSVGGFTGAKSTDGLTYEVAINFDGDSLPSEVEVPAGATITNIIEDFATGAVSSATVGGVDVSAAEGDTKATNVPVSAGGKLVVSGPSAGTVVVEYIYSV